MNNEIIDSVKHKFISSLKARHTRKDAIGFYCFVCLRKCVALLHVWLSPVGECMHAYAWAESWEMIR